MAADIWSRSNANLMPAFFVGPSAMTLALAALLAFPFPSFFPLFLAIHARSFFMYGQTLKNRCLLVVCSSKNTFLLSALLDGRSAIRCHPNAPISPRTWGANGVLVSTSRIMYSFVSWRAKRREGQTATS